MRRHPTKIPVGTVESRATRSPLELVAVGHVTIDHVGGEERMGGAAAFASVTAARLGLRAGLVTSAASDYPFWKPLADAGVEVHALEAGNTTIFENRYDANGRRSQRLLEVSSPIGPEALDAVRGRVSEDAAVLYCPVAREITSPLVPLGPRGLSAVAPQGFFRKWDDAGNVTPAEWPDAEGALRAVDFVSMSEEDAEAPEELAAAFSGRAFAITRGERGARVYGGGSVLDVPAFPRRTVDPTGAGDVFAAAFLVALREGKGVLEAGVLASAAASFAVERVGLDGVATRKAVFDRARARLSGLARRTKLARGVS